MSGNQLVVRITVMTSLVMLAGIFVAGATLSEQLTASWTANGIEVNACNLVENKFYQIRYYQPGTTMEEEPYDATNNQDGYYTPFPKFASDPYTGDSCYTETFTNPPYGGQGEWTIWLMKAGNAVNSDPDGAATSYRIKVPLNVPIPEFPTLALPIAAIIGIMFIFQSRTRKED